MSDGGGILWGIREGGFFALVVVGFGVLGTLLAFVSAIGAVVAKKRGMVLGLAGLCFFVVVGLLAVGGIGMMLGTSKVNEVLDLVAAADRERLAMRGYAEAQIPLNYALVFSILPFLAAIACAGLAFTKKASTE